ncbi:hypothetical protein QQX98_004565 [Neonectria punicea]|uniref:Uncharacterized protein n=1 Tax=Neonectria punicea TaxID=979145 RepID=A0ABR1H8I7_9HYPO
MRFSTALLLLVPLVAAVPATDSAKALPDLSGAGESGFDFSDDSDGLSLAAAKVCPAKYPRYCSIGGFCCRTKKCCKKQCCQNSAKYCIKGLCYK